MFQKMINSIEKLIGGGARPPNKPSSNDLQDGQSSHKQKSPKQIVIFRWAMIVILLGASAMIVSNFMEVDQMIVSPTTTEQHYDLNDQLATSPSSDSPFSMIENQLEQRTKDILEKMIGVGKVNVLITVESTEEQVIELNKNESKSVTQETDKNGGLREITTTTNDGQVVFMEGNGEQEPVVTKIINPRIRGVLIVAEGAEDATVRKLIIQAVEKGLNVHQSKISVVPSKI